MSTIQDIKKEYPPSIDQLDSDLILAHALKKPREFVLTHPEFTINKRQEALIKKFFQRRERHEPLAYISGHKEFYGLDFKVNKNTLIPRPETELLVDLVLKDILKIGNRKSKIVVDVGSGSGNILIALAKSLEKNSSRALRVKFYAADISQKTLRVARENAKKHSLEKKIKFFRGDLLKPILEITKSQKLKAGNYFIVANLPYLSRKIYASVSPDVKDFEPRAALLSQKNGLAHYERLCDQVKKLSSLRFAPRVACFFEISPEQKNPLAKIIKKSFPEAKISAFKDLAGKWRALSFFC